MSSLFPMGKWRLVGTIAILSIGVPSLAAIFGGGPLVPALLVFGVLILMPLVALLGGDLPLVAEAPAEGNDSMATAADPVELLRERYARGELSKEEFETRLDRLLATEELPVEQTADPQREVVLDNE